jgi:hypothetical protein
LEQCPLCYTHDTTRIILTCNVDQCSRMVTDHNVFLWAICDRKSCKPIYQPLSQENKQELGVVSIQMRTYLKLFLNCIF